MIVTVPTQVECALEDVNDGEDGDPHEDVEDLPMETDRDVPDAAEESEKDVTGEKTQFPRIPYQLAQERTQRRMRSEIITSLQNILHSYCHGEESAIPNLAKDIIECGKFGSVFGISQKKKQDYDDTFLASLAREYKLCKDKEQNKAIRERGAKMKEKVLIGNTLKDSKISTSELGGTNRVEQAANIGRVRTYGEERRRLLSIVAHDFSYSTLQDIFSCCKSTITAARVHATLFGRGGVPCEGLKFTRQVLSKEVIEEFVGFLHREDISRPSSCRSVLVGKVETPVRYWKHSLKDVVKQYHVEFPAGVKRSYIYSNIPANFRMDKMLAGPC